MKAKRKLQDYTETEFLYFLSEFFEDRSGLEGDAFEKYQNKLVDEFIRLTEHPDKSDLIYWPKEGNNSSPTSILKTVKEWRAKNGKPGFKPS